MLFVSGLYGLVLWDELIQEYDCHFGDYTKDQRKQTVAEMWDGLLTDALCEFIKGQAGRPIKFVYELLSEETYQNLFEWERVSGCGVKVYHRIFKGVAGPDILSSLATVLSKQFERFLPSPEQFREGWYTVGRGREPGFEFGFECELGRDPLATREGEIDEARQALCEGWPVLRDAPEKRIHQLILAEHSWRKVNALKVFDWGAIIVSYAKAVESNLALKVPGCGRRASLGALAELVCNMPDRGWSELCSDLHRLAKLRNEGAHQGKSDRPDGEEARDLAIRIITRAETLAREQERRR